MKLYKHEFKGIDGVKGYVVLRMPTFAERMSISREVTTNGEVDLDKAMGLIEKVPEYIEEIKVSVYEQDCKTFEEISYYDVAIPMVSELMTVLIQGLPNPKLKASQKK